MYKTFFLTHGKSPPHIKRFKILNLSHKLVWFCRQKDSCITACPDPFRHYHWLAGSDLRKENTCQSISLHYSYFPLPWAFYRILWISASPRLLIAGLHNTKPPIILHFQRKSHKRYCPPMSVTWLQLLHKQTNTDTCNALTAETYWYIHKQFHTQSWLMTSARACQRYPLLKTETLWN